MYHSTCITAFEHPSNKLSTFDPQNQDKLPVIY